MTIPIKPGVEIDEDELTFRTSRSGGPGGQNVNKVSTKVTVFFDVKNSPSLSAQQKRRILSTLATRADKLGVVRVTSQKHRTQQANRQAAVERLIDLIADALTPKKIRKETKVPRRVKQQRLEEKHRRSETKQRRQPPKANDY